MHLLKWVNERFVSEIRRGKEQESYGKIKES